MNWLCIMLLIGGGVVGYIAGATRAHLANQRYLDELDQWINTQKRRGQ
jgi:hypothetical protein